MSLSFEWEQFDDRLWRMARTETNQGSSAISWAGDAYRVDDGRWKAIEPDGTFTMHATADEAKKALVSRVAPNGEPVTEFKP